MALVGEGPRLAVRSAQRSEGLLQKLVVPQKCQKLSEERVPKEWRRHYAIGDLLSPSMNRSRAGQWFFKEALRPTRYSHPMPDEINDPGIAHVREPGT